MQMILDKKARLLFILILFCCLDASANPLFYKRIRYVDYFDQAQEYIYYDSNNNNVSREYQGVVYDSRGNQIGIYTDNATELYQDRFYYSNAGKYLGSSRFLYINSSGDFKLIFYDSSKKKIDTFSKPWSLSTIVDFFLEGAQMRLIHD